MFVFSFAAGTTDGPGEFDFTQGANTTNPFWDFVSGLLKDPSPEQEACHAPKPILLDTGEVSTVHIVFLKAPRYVNSHNSAISLKHNHSKAELLKVDIFFALNFLSWEFLLIKSWKLRKLRPPRIQLLKLI